MTEKTLDAYQSIYSHIALDKAFRRFTGGIFLSFGVFSLCVAALLFYDPIYEN